jgi:acyl transferase domain-containing protein
MTVVGLVALLRDHSRESLLSRVASLIDSLNGLASLDLTACSDRLLQAALQCPSTAASSWRIAATAHDIASLVDELRRVVPVHIGATPCVALAVPGMGTEWFWSLDWPRLSLSDALLASLDASSVRSLDDAKALQRRDLAAYQRLLFALHLALHHVLVRQCGFRYDRLCSFSAGEPTAAALSGAFAVHTAAHLNRAMSRVNHLPIARGIDSTMVVCINAPLDAVQRALATHGGEVGAYIGHNLNAVCGLRASMDALCADLTAQLPLATIRQTGLPLAFHSAIFEQFRARVRRRIRIGSPSE